MIVTVRFYSMKEFQVADATLFERVITVPEDINTQAISMVGDTVQMVIDFEPANATSIPGAVIIPEDRPEDPMLSNKRGVRL